MITAMWTANTSITKTALDFAAMHRGALGAREWLAREVSWLEVFVDATAPQATVCRDRVWRLRQ